MASAITSLLITIQMLAAATAGHVVLVRDRPAEIAGAAGAGDTSCARWVWRDEWTCPANLWRVRMSPDLEFTRPIDLGGPDSEELLHRLVALATLAHELAHVYDALDDGRLNGSPGHPRPEGFREAQQMSHGRRLWEPSPWYCWTGQVDEAVVPVIAPSERAQAEWYACEVVRTGRLR